MTMEREDVGLLSLDLKERAKERAAVAALDYVQDGAIVGLGSGSTAEIFVRLLGARAEATGLRVACLPTSEKTGDIAREAGLTLLPVDQADRIDVTVDGADEVDTLFQLIKGAGGALLREKIIAHASDHMVVIVDDSKMVDRLGAFPLPVEVDKFAFTITAKKVFDALRTAGCANANVDVRVNASDRPFVTDGGHYILDCQVGAIPDADYAARLLARIPGVVEHGLFINLAGTVIVGDDERVEVLER